MSRLLLLWRCTSMCDSEASVRGHGRMSIKTQGDLEQNLWLHCSPVA